MDANRVEHHGGQMMRVYKPKEFMFSISFIVAAHCWMNILFFNKGNLKLFTNGK